MSISILIKYKLLNADRKITNKCNEFLHFCIKVYEGLDILFFNIFVLGSLETKTGKVWRKNCIDMCYVELTEVIRSNVILFIFIFHFH